MGFSLHGYGNVHKCGISGNKVYYLDGCGVKHEYPCTLDVDIHEQCNIFASVTVAFYLTKDEMIYIGRTDGVISIYRVCSDGRWLLIGIQHWDAPPIPHLEIAGYKRGETIVYPIYINKEDNRTLYCAHRNAEGHLLKPFEGEFLTSVQVIDALSTVNPDGYNVFDEGGVKLETDVWSIQESLWRRDCKVFL